MTARHLLTEDEIHTLLHNGSSRRQPTDTPSNAALTSDEASQSTISSQLSDALLNSIQSELRQLRSMMALGINSVSLSGSNGYSLKARILQRLVALGFSLTACEKLLNGLPLASDEDTAWQQILISLQTQLPIARENLLDHQGIIAFVGPTGSGKTTQIAKLASQFVQRHNHHDIGLITTDYHSVSGRDQLCTYGRLLDIPVHRVNNRTDLSESLSNLSDKRLILIDTPGLSHRDNAFTEKMELLLQQPKPINTILTLSATTHEKILDEIVASFNRIRLTGVSITKIDEAPFIGHVLSTCIENQLRIFTLTNGQHAPYDLTIATIDNVINSALREGGETSINKQNTEVEECVAC